MYLGGGTFQFACCLQHFGAGNLSFACTAFRPQNARFWSKAWWLTSGLPSVCNLGLVTTTEAKGHINVFFPAWPNRESLNDNTEGSVTSQFWTPLSLFSGAKNGAVTRSKHANPFTTIALTIFKLHPSEMSLSTVSEGENFCKTYIWQSMPTFPKDGAGARGPAFVNV